jgi:hypothetical protein
MAGLVPAIHVFLDSSLQRDARRKAGHDAFHERATSRESHVLLAAFSVNI